MGCGPMERITELLANSLPPEYDVTVACSSNRQLLRRMERRFADKPNIHIRGFISNVSVLMDSADLFLTKPGGISTTEAMVKGLPMVLVNVVGGCETPNLNFFVSHGGAATAGTPEDIAACDGALRVVAVTEDHPFNDGRTVSHKESDGEGGVVSVLDTVYDVRELRLTSVGVQLPGAQETWRVFHHFLWTTDPGFYGTEALQIRPAYRSIPEGWSAAGDVTGRVLYDRDGQTFAAPYASLGAQTFTANTVLWGKQTNTDLFAAFSLPRHAEHARGYVAYSTTEARDGYILSSGVYYTHQQSWLQYPVVTAMEKRLTTTWGDSGAFRTVQHALQFFPADGQLLR